MRRRADARAVHRADRRALQGVEPAHANAQPQLARGGRARGTTATLLRRLAPILERGTAACATTPRRFDAVDPPAGDAAEIARLRRLYDQQAQFVRRLAAAAGGATRAAFESLTAQQEDVVTRARRLSRAYGFKECGSTKSDAA